MNYSYSVYTVDGDKPGQILRVGNVSNPVDLTAQAKPGQGVLPVQVDSTTHWVTGGQIEERPKAGYSETLEVPVGQNVTLLIPPGGKVRLPPQRWNVVPDGEVQLEFDRPGRYIVDVRPPWPYQEYVVTILCPSS